MCGVWCLGKRLAGAKPDIGGQKELIMLTFLSSIILNENSHVSLITSFWMKGAKPDIQGQKGLPLGGYCFGISLNIKSLIQSFVWVINFSGDN